jgi:hypothetical protein
MKRISYCISGFLVVVAPFHSAFGASTVPNKQVPKSVSKVKQLKDPPPRFPAEYRILEKAKKDWSPSSVSSALAAAHQAELQRSGWMSTNKTYGKEAEDLYWFYEIARAEKLKGVAALDAWIKALNSVNQFKWIYAWTESTSKALASHCIKKKTPKKVISFADQVKAEKCSYLVRRVTDAFPKVALEIQPLKEFLPENNGTVDAITDRYERLGQSYTEKVEKDEESFSEILDHYLNRRNSDLYKTGKAFVEEYPKSMLRFRTLFLMAERQFAAGDRKEAEKNYTQIIQQTPFSYYSILSSERLGLALTEKIDSSLLNPVDDLQSLRLSLFEKDSLCRVENLVKLKKEEPVGIELEQFSRVRQYSTPFLIQLFQYAHSAGQDLAGFRFATEVLQRRGEAPLNRNFIDMVFPDRFLKEIGDQSKASKVDPLLVISLMKQESGFKRSILSGSGAVGLMQLMPFTALEVQKDLYLRQLREPAKNIEVGTKYLASLLNDRFNGNVVYALAGYNAGPTRVSKWRKEAKPDWGMQEFIEAIPYKETRDYVMSILRNRYWYQYRKGMKPQSVMEAWRTP